THRPTFPQVGDAPYLNDGSCVHRGCITAIEIKHGMIALVRWCEKPTQSGSPLYLREVIGGPRPLLNVVTDKTKPLHLAGV
ncbi:MAG: serine/threonine protein phosphatase, partial [Bacillota bacterium]